MGRMLAVVAMLATWTGVAFSADFSWPRTVPDSTYASWTGFYLGMNGGGGWAEARSEFSAGGPVFATAKNPLMGAIGGGQLGYNWQSGLMVFGAEADIQYANIKGTLDAPPCPVAACGVALSASYTQKMPWFGTARGRAGLALNGWLAYVTGGYTYARFETSATATAGPATASVSQTETRSGWTLGAGIEVALLRSWSAKLEYLYLDYGTKNATFAIAGLPTLTDSVRLNENVVRLGVNYRF